MSRNPDTVPLLGGGPTQSASAASNQPYHEERHHHTYVVGENTRRLQQTANKLGLKHARRPKHWTYNVRKAIKMIMADTTLESARMHSVGVLGEDERIDESGTLHLLTLTRRKRRTTIGAGPEPAASEAVAGASDYGTLHDLFQQPSSSQVETVPEDEEPDEDDEDVELVETDIVEGGSLIAAIFGIIKGTVGPAILYLPHGFAQSGYGIAIVAMICSTCCYLYSANRLLQCWKIEKQTQMKIDELRDLLLQPSKSPFSTPKSSSNNLRKLGGNQQKIDEVEDQQQQASAAPASTSSLLLTYPELSKRAFGPQYSMLVKLGIAGMQFGVCLTYLIFVPQNLYEIVKDLYHFEINKIYLLVFMVLIEIPLSWIHDIRKLTTTNIIATILIAYGLVSCLLIAVGTTIDNSVGVDYDAAIASTSLLQDDDKASATLLEDATSTLLNDSDTIVTVRSLWERIQELPLTNPDTWFLFVGTSFFVFEGSITLIVPLQEAVYLQADKERFPKVNIQVTSSIVVFYVFFAMICWASFGNTIQTALTASLPPSFFATIVQLSYSVAVILTFPLQAFPAMEVVFGSSSTHNIKDDFALIRRNILSSLVIVLLGIVAYLAIDYLGNVVSLLGSLVGIPIALIFPPLMHTILSEKRHGSVGGSNKLTITTKILNYTISTLGIIAMCVASYTTIIMWDKGAE